MTFFLLPFCYIGILKGKKVGRTIVVTSGKGGVGKTTSAANIGAALALAGKKTVVVDADIGLRNLDVVLGLETSIVFNLVDITEGKCRIKQALIADKRIGGLFLIAAAQTRDKTAVTPEQMKKLNAELAESFDFTIIDCPAGIERGFRNAIAGTDEAIIVTTPQVSAIRDADRILSLLEAEDIAGIKLVINRVRPEMMRKGEMMTTDDILDILPVPLLGIVPENNDIVVSTNRGEPIVLYEQSLTAQAYKNIAARLCGEERAFIDLERKNTFFSRIASMF